MQANRHADMQTCKPAAAATVTPVLAPPSSNCPHMLSRLHAFRPLASLAAPSHYVRACVCMRNTLPLAVCALSGTVTWT